ncbi:OmpA family protein [Persicimonas caeni]|uniref:OmpA family protein n=2 Tax=Persicimonas caeni TaxID=2292766 RepID=A0A4Y6Q2V6_PERCE|nr:OmpA family protein [Persicimonas caeni]QED36108.1 OmpA family protein [Persicimonas caeni]
MMVALLSLGTVGCSTGAKLRGQAKEIQALNETIHERAYRCAPHEIAIAESSVEFGLYELNQGDFVRARNHIYRAEEHAKKADKMSDFDECRDQAVAMQVEKTPTVEVAEAKPQPKDQDGDGLLDNEDQCPMDPEDIDGFEDEDGCPDDDNDGDGIADVTDQCPFVKEDVDGFRDEDGCPEFDNDFDGIADLNDQCAGKPEDFDGYQDEDGCPETDNDADGIADMLDKCPLEAEDYDGDVDDDGCPEERKLVKVEGDQIKLNEKVHFKTAKSDILPQSYPLLNEVAEVLAANPTIKVRIEGHTDSRGSDRYNQKLSDERAASVVQYLVGRGIDSSRMLSKGFGEDRPIEDNATKAGRAANRRVEIHITER